MRLFGVLAIAITVFGTVSAACAEDLSLVCRGSGTYPEARTSSGSSWNYSTGQPTYGSSTQTDIQNINADIRFELVGDTARILMPPAMTPPINGGSDRGWWTLERLEVTEEAISGRFDLNVFNKPRVHIDRRTGVIEVDGNFRYYFLGECSLAEDQPARRF